MTFSSTFGRVFSPTFQPKSQAPAAAVSSWWLAGGIDPANCVAAYQPKGAASYEASKVNLANSGTYDLTDGSSHPEWVRYSGLIFTNDSLVIGSGTGATLKPFTLIAKIKRTSSATNKTILGGNDGNCIQWRLDVTHKSEIVKQGVAVIAESTTAVGDGSEIIAVSYSSSGDYAFYADGTADRTGTNNVEITADTDTVGKAAISSHPFEGTIEFLSIYNTVLTPTQIMAVTVAIKAATVAIEAEMAEVKFIVFDGNSMTDATYSTYPAATVSQLTGSWVDMNVGVGGQTTANMITDAESEIDFVYDPAFADNVLVCWEGTNDLKLGATAVIAYNNLVTYCSDRRSAGYKVVILTVLPRSETGLPETFESDRQTVNTSIRANWATFADAIADVAADNRIGDYGDSDDTTYYVDKVHLTEAGYDIVAGIVSTVVNNI